MSHFTVLVIGPDPEKQLAPYHEFECTGIDDEYVVEVEESIDDYLEEMQASSYPAGTTLAHFLSDYHSIPQVPFGVKPDINGNHKYHYYQVAKDGSVTRIVHRTNPNKKWDWYTLGGRWAGYLRLRSGAKVDQAKKRWIDLQGMMAEAADEAGKEWDKVHAAIADTPNAESWGHVHEIRCKGNLEAARHFYRSQERVVKFQALEDMNYFASVEDYQCSREAYTQAAADSAISTFAILKDGVWYEKGQMGWWGMVANAADQKTWDAQVRKLLEDTPGDTLISLYDCHI